MVELVAGGKPGAVALRGVGATIRCHCWYTWSYANLLGNKGKDKGGNICNNENGASEEDLNVQK